MGKRRYSCCTQTAGVTIANAEFQNVGAISITPAEGGQYAELDTDWDGPGGSINDEPANVIISQTFDTAPGAVYHISYYQRYRNGQCDLQFDWTGDSPVTTTGDLNAWKFIEFDRHGSPDLKQLSHLLVLAPQILMGHC